MKNFFLLFVSMVIVNNLCAQQTKETTNWLTQTDTLHHFSFSYPAEWTLKLPGTNTRFFVTSPKKTDNDDFRENINCITRVLEQKDFTVKMAEDAIKESLSEKLTDFKLLRSEYITWNGSETLEIDYTCTRESEGTTYYIHILQRMAVIGGTLFTLTFTSEADTYSKYLPTVKKIMQSLKVK